jgi:hypothetical protein
MGSREPVKNSVLVLILGRLSNMAFVKLLQLYSSSAMPEVVLVTWAVGVYRRW